MLIEVKENRMETEKRKLFLLMNKKASTEIWERHFPKLDNGFAKCAGISQN
jgi:hypothetical protein